MSIPACSPQMQRKVHRLEWEYQKRTELHRMSEEKDKDRLFLISILSNDTYHISKHKKKKLTSNISQLTPHSVLFKFMERLQTCCNYIREHKSK